MIDKVEKNPILLEISGWILFNMLAFFLVGFSYFFGASPDRLQRLHSIVNIAFVDQAIYIAANILIIGGGVLIASCQWIFLRHRRDQITGGGWVWVISGLISSIPAFCLLIILGLGAGVHPTQLDDLLFLFTIISGQVLLLSIVQGFLLHINRYNAAGEWVTINLLGYGVTSVSSFSLWGRIDNLGPYITLTLMMIFVTGVSGWKLIRILESHKDSTVD